MLRTVHHCSYNVILVVLDEALQLLQEKDCPIGPVYRGEKIVGILDKENIEELLTLNKAMQQYLDSPIRDIQGGKS